MSNQGNIIIDNGNISNIASLTSTNALVTSSTITSLISTSSIITSSTYTNLYVTGTGITNLNQPFYSIKSTATQSISNNSTTTLNGVWGTPGAVTNFTYSSGIVTILVAGTYLCVGIVSWNSNASGQRNQNFNVNGTTNYGVDICIGANINQIATCSSIITFAVNDTIKIQVYQNCGSALLVLSTDCQFQLYKIG